MDIFLCLNKFDVFNFILFDLSVYLNLSQSFDSQPEPDWAQQVQLAPAFVSLNYLLALIRSDLTLFTSLVFSTSV